MRAPALVQQFTYVVGVFQSLPSLIENSPHLSYLLGKIANKKKRLEDTKHTSIAAAASSMVSQTLREQRLVRW